MSPSHNEITDLLKPYQRFGVHLGLERIVRLLEALGNPHQKIPLIHVAGTNGKGSVCAYLSAILTAAGYRVGRYTSPHLVDWTERICLNQHPIKTEELVKLLVAVETTIAPDQEKPTLFEMITAAAWLYFAQSQVDIAVIEVGLGGRLDATNICNHPLVSVITSISREHWQQLGPTLADIAREKAGILKRSCPAVIAPQPIAVRTVIESKLQALECPAKWVTPATRLPTNSAQQASWVSSQGITYPIPLLGEIQLLNSALTIATIQLLQQQNWSISTEAIQLGMSQAQWPGRIQWIQWQGRNVLLDGAHNVAAAKSLRQYVDTLTTPITWIVGMLSTKDSDGILTHLLRAGDEIYFVPVPDHSTTPPQLLADQAKEIEANLEKIRVFPELFQALDHLASERQAIICGSLYLVGYFLKQLKEMI